MFSRLGVMQLGQTYLSFTNHLSIYIWKDLNKRPTILRGISWGMPARGSQSWFRRRRRGRNATSLGSTDAGLDSQWRVVKGLAPGSLEIECNDMQLLQLNAVSATIYDCIMQLQYINTCEMLHPPSRQQFPNIPGLNLTEVLPSWLKDLAGNFDYVLALANSVLRTPGGLARSKETNAFNIRNFGQGIGGPRNDTILVGLLFQDGKIPLCNSWLLYLLSLLLCPAMVQDVS